VQERTAALTHTNEKTWCEIRRAMSREGTAQLLARRDHPGGAARISRELHDQLGQDLHALMLGLKSLKTA
jgi:signal transduction histidine kinase